MNSINSSRVAQNWISLSTKFRSKLEMVLRNDDMGMNENANDNNVNGHGFVFGPIDVYKSAEYSSVEDTKARLQITNSSLTREIVRLKEKLDKADARINDKDGIIVLLQEEIAQLKMSNESSMKALTSAQNELRLNDREVKSITAEFEIFATCFSKVKSIQAETASEIVRLSSELNSAYDHINSLTSKHERLQSAVAVRDSQIANFNMKSEQFRSKELMWSTGKRLLTELNDSLQQKMKRMETTLLASQTNCDDLSAEIQMMNETMKTMESFCNELWNAFDDLQDELRQRKLNEEYPSKQEQSTERLSRCDSNYWKPLFEASQEDTNGQPTNEIEPAVKSTPSMQIALDENPLKYTCPNVITQGSSVTSIESHHEKAAETVNVETGKNKVDPNSSEASDIVEPNVCEICSEGPFGFMLTCSSCHRNQVHSSCFRKSCGPNMMRGFKHICTECIHNDRRNLDANF